MDKPMGFIVPPLPAMERAVSRWLCRQAIVRPTSAIQCVGCELLLRPDVAGNRPAEEGLVDWRVRRHFAKAHGFPDR
jgi:hypothetical protein